MAGQPRSIAPDTAPGGLVFVVSAGGYVWSERRWSAADATAPTAGPGGLEVAAAADGELCRTVADRFGEACLTVYDGDTGELFARYTVHRAP
jgi:hypothetical protein